MARRNYSKKSKRSGSKKRRVGAVGGGDGVQLILGAIGGAVVSGIVASKLPATMDAKIKGAILAVAGFFVAKQKSPLIKGMGIGVAASGGLTVAKSLLPAGTIGEIGYMAGFDQYANSPQMNTIAGFDQYANSPQNNVISGVDNRIAAGAGLA